jgi:DNA replication protein DnaC
VGGADPWHARAVARADCELCDGTGFVPVDDRAATVRRCSCETQAATETDLVALGMPRRYLHCTFDSFLTRNASQRRALGVARGFTEEFATARQGLLFTGTCGVGKTHLAAAVLRSLVLEQGVRGAFADYQDLLKRIQATFSRSGPGSPSEEDVLAPVLRADLLVLDDLGSRRSTEWAEDTIAHVLNVRYNESRLTVLTTNLLDLDADASGGRHQVPGDNLVMADRLPERVISRLHEMCRKVHVAGPDHRVREVKPRAAAGEQAR